MVPQEATEDPTEVQAMAGEVATPHLVAMADTAPCTPPTGVQCTADPLHPLVGGDLDMDPQLARRTVEEGLRMDMDHHLLVVTMDATEQSHLELCEIFAGHFSHSHVVMLLCCMRLPCCKVTRMRYFVRARGIL